MQRYGIVDGVEVSDNIYEVKNLVEKPKLEDAPSNLGITGRYILTSDIFDKLKNTKPGVGGEIQLTDAINAQDNVYATTFEGQADPHEKYIVLLVVFVGSLNGVYAFLSSLSPVYQSTKSA